MKLNIVITLSLLIIGYTAHGMQPPQPRVLPPAINPLSTIAAIQPQIDLVANALVMYNLQIQQMLNQPIPRPLPTIHLEVPVMPHALPQAPAAPYVAPTPANAAAAQPAAIAGSRKRKRTEPSEKETDGDIQTTTSSSSSSSAVPQAQQRKRRHGLELTNEDGKIVAIAIKYGTGHSWKCTYNGCQAKPIESAQQARDHYDTHYGTQRHTCPTCFKKFTFQEGLIEHAQVEHYGKRFSCVLCKNKKEYRGRKGYHEHMLLKHDIDTSKRRKINKS